VALLWFLAPSLSCFAYSVLSHEALIDVLWDSALKPALLQRFPNAAPEQLKEAHSYAYGGAIIQDMGYYPHGNGYFSDLTHYARSADFILALLRDSQSLDEYAFALGALSHYASDNNGHRLATNVGIPMLYPKLGRKFGKTVTYEDSPVTHLRIEYAFDVEEVAKENFAPQAYHDFIGFNVARPVLEQAFRETYGFELTVLFKDFDRTIGSYRHTLSTLIPFFTRVAWALHEDEIERARPGTTKRQFLYAMRRSSYEREWGRDYDRPTWRERLIAFIVKIFPPIGRIKILKFRALTPPVEQKFMESFNVATTEYRSQVSAARSKRLALEDTNFDVGVPCGPGGYKLQDQTYAYWVDRLAQGKFSSMTPEVSRDILSYYSDMSKPFDTRNHPKDWKKLMGDLQDLKSAATQEVTAAGRR